MHTGSPRTRQKVSIKIYWVIGVRENKTNSMVAAIAETILFLISTANHILAGQSEASLVKSMLWPCPFYKNTQWEPRKAILLLLQRA